MNLFQNADANLSANDNRVDFSRPLADRMRPRSLDEFLGQNHLIGPGKPLRVQIETDQLTSLIFWGPPGVGKTTLASIIARMTHSTFLTFSAVLSGIKEIKEVMTKAEQARQYGSRTIVFIDEIHRFNKAQQDAFLPHVERGNIILIGATTENPSFEVISPLLSRSRVYVLNALNAAEIITLLKRALADKERGLGNETIEIPEAVLERMAVYSNGDARMAYNILEAAVAGMKPDANGAKQISEKDIEAVLQKKTLLYDKTGEEHYNIISALHKSVRNSDADAALYWLARMLEAGEDPLYVARRVVRMASEDIGLADPRALSVAIDAMRAVDFIGMPEGKLALAEAVVYLSLAPKSNALYEAYDAAQRDATETIAEPVPLQIRNAPTRLMKDLGYGKDYQYAHNYEDRITDMQCLPENLKERVYYQPTEFGLEKTLKEKLAWVRSKIRNK
ncbi:MAG: replication-associated recombination protein A [Acidobacteriia bacterium]|nr:replication-associated recombination protein A [Terriglobia bacterium]